MRRQCLILLILFALSGTACGQDAANAPPINSNDPAMQELAEILRMEPPPQTLEEAKTKFADVRPKLAEFAGKYKDEPVGKQALGTMMQMALMTGDFDNAMKDADLFLERYPDSSEVADVKFIRALLMAESNDVDGAREALQLHLKEYPDFRDKASVEALLARIDIVGSDVKQFTTKTLACERISLEDLRGKVVLLDFFASWCPPCRTEVPHLKKAYEKYSARGFEILGVSLDRTLEDVKSYVEKEGIDWIVTWEEPGFWNNPVARLYGVQSIPSTFLIDADGKVVATDVRGDALETALEKIFAGKDAATTEPAAAK